ncbi:MAG TPA: HAMP domain-containing sensor histidine kinase, partial [Gemmatimonadales bacterium]|nr:HAMP domain-containing sensor histidine kinase [Gemmatimonadales bacterium]
LSPAADSLLPCGDPGSSPRFTFAIDLRTNAMTTAGASPAPAIRAWLLDSIGAEARASAASLARYGVAWAPGAGVGSGARESGAVAVYGVKPVRYNGYAAHDAPLAVYGVVSCPAAMARLVAGVVTRHPLLPARVAGGLPTARLVGLAVTDPWGRELYRSGPSESPSGYAGDSAATAGSIVVRAWLPPEVAGRLVVAEPGARLPLLLGLFALTAALTAVAALQFRREQELVRLRQDFTSSVSHELRTPLTQILLFGETLELGRAGGEDARREAVGVIVQEARRLAHLVENVLHLSRAERRMVRVNPSAAPLAPLLREIVERFAPLAGADAVRIRTELDESLVALVDADALHQIVINLLDNAIKYGGQGVVTLRATLRSGAARIEVEDAGPGVPAAERSRVWEPFVRLQPDGGVPGSGIGLAVVRELVAAHGGTCGVETASQGGARFVLELPGAGRLDTARASHTSTEVAWPAS